MSLYPKSKSGKVAYFNSKTTPWSANAVALGTTVAVITDLETRVAAAQEKLAAQLAAEQAAKAATAAADAAVAAVVHAGADVIRTIRATAANSPNPQGIYDLAQIPARATPTPISTLGTPSNCVAALGADGALTIKWKCASPRATGVVYQVWRKLQNEAEFSYLGGTGEKKFTDATVPAGSALTMYRIQAVRSTAQGPWAVFTVLFGTGAGGQVAASVVQPKLAA